LDQEVIEGSSKRTLLRQAFTLIELLLVMTLLTVVFALSMPSLSRFFRGRALDVEARRLLSLARHGQSRAASEGIPMELWVNEKAGAYGLEADATYLQNDDKAREFSLGRDLTIEVPQSPVTLLSQTEQERKRRTAAASAHSNLPKLRFLPDGAPDIANPRYLRLFDHEGAALDIAMTRNRLGYEVGMATNNEVDLSTRR
jgi:prepilin-type N-terminal cleavage/methylation domain-containing protein